MVRVSPTWAVLGLFFIVLAFEMDSVNTVDSQKNRGILRTVAQPRAVI